MNESPMVIDAATGLHFQHGQNFRAALSGFLGAAERAGINIHKHRQAVNAGRIDSMLAQGGRRDSFSPDAGLHMSRQLEHVYTEILREEYPKQNAFELFPVDSSVPPGARTHTVRRLYQDGEASVYRAGQPVPMVEVSQQEEQFPVRHLVNGFVLSIFEMASSGFAGTNEAAELLKTARDVIMEYANLLFWHGSTTHKVYGVTNYPWLPKRVMAIAINDDSAADDILASLNDLANFPTNNTKGVLAPDTIATSPRIINYLFTRLRSAVATSDTTIGEQFLRNQKRIKGIEEAHELQGAGPGGSDGILCYRRDRRGINIVIPQGFTTLPVQSLGFDEITHGYMSIGGAIMRDVGNNILGWATPPDL